MNESAPAEKNSDKPPTEVAPVERPGKLAGEISIELHTSYAVQLLHGRKNEEDRPGIVGLVGFGHTCAGIKSRPRLDAIESRLKDAETRIRQFRRQTESSLKKNHLKVENFTSVKPVSMTLKFASPLAFRGAQLLCEYDDLVCQILLIHRIGVYDVEEMTLRLQAAGKCLRSAFASAGAIKISKPPAAPAEQRSAAENKVEKQTE